MKSASFCSAILVIVTILITIAVKIGYMAGQQDAIDGKYSYGYVTNHITEVKLQKIK